MIDGYLKDLMPSGAHKPMVQQHDMLDPSLHLSRLRRGRLHIIFLSAFFLLSLTDDEQ